MSKVEQLGGSMVKLTLEISPEKFEQAIRTVYNKQKHQISIPGFRKGKVPYQMVVRAYGKEVFYEDALNEVLPDEYQQAVEEEKLDVMSRPNVNVEKIVSGEPIVVTCELAVRPEVKLGEYKGLKKEQTPVEVTEEDIKNELDRIANTNARTLDITDRPVQADDTVNIDYAGTVDGVAFDGGTAEGYDLKIGSHSFIDTFEDQIIGHAIGEEFDVNVTFPEEYHAAELAGKPAVFHVKVNGIKAKELPEINDEFAQDVSEFDTLEEYKEDLKKAILERKEKAAESELKNKVLDDYKGKSVVFLVYDRKKHGKDLDELEKNLISKANDQKVVFIHIDTRSPAMDGTGAWADAAVKRKGEHYAGKKNRYDSMFSGHFPFRDGQFYYELYAPDGTCTLQTTDKKKAFAAIGKLVKQ